MDSLACVGIDVGGTYIKGGVVRDDGTVLAEKNKKTNGNQGPDAVLESIVRLVQELISESEAPVQGVGVGVPGQIDVARGMVRSAESPRITQHSCPTSTGKTARPSRAFGQ